MTQSAPTVHRAEARFIPLDLGKGLRRQQQEAVAGDLVQPFEHPGAVRQQAPARCRGSVRFRRSLGRRLRACRRGRDSRSIHSRTTGSAVLHMSSLGSSERATPSTTTMVFCNSSSSGRVRMSNSPVTSNNSVSSLRH